MSELLASAVDRLRRVSGVDDAAVWTSRSVVRNMISVADAGGVRQVAAPLYNYMVVSPSYVRTMGLRIVQGRDFMEAERDQPVVIVDRVMAHTLWPNANPIGGLIKLGDAQSALPYVRVVGVMAPQIDPRSNAPARERFLYPAVRQLGGTLYLPGARDSAVARGDSVLRYNMNFITRTRGDVSKMILELRRGGIRWPDVHPSGIVSMSDFLGIARARNNAAFVSRMFMFFGVLALGLATLGVYGVVAYGVAERRRELGVRVALGATSKDILHAVLRETVVLALAGVALGLLLTKYGVPLLQAFALEDDFYNAPLFALVAVVLFSATAMSALVPALRATRVDPTESLRAE
ncbi:MAG TPA: FtsX-like permease family protein [Gemmatimonadaceae bacterium]